jgi:hypothetical protein
MLHVRINVPPHPAALQAVAEGLVGLNAVLMRLADERGVAFPLLYESGARYRREPRGEEWWESATDILGVTAQGTGDCEDLAAYRAAELRYVFGEPARVAIKRTRRGSFHAVVERADGTIEDPSRVLLALEQLEAGHVR